MSDIAQSTVFPVLPLRDIVVFPHMIVPLFVGREKSINALEEVMRSDKQILLAAQKNAGDDDPAPDAIYHIVKRLNREFVILLVFALLVAFPLAFYAVGRWLETFAYHRDVPPLLYVVALLITLLVTVLTVSIQAYRVAVADPVKALRYE